MCEGMPLRTHDDDEYDRSIAEVYEEKVADLRHARVMLRLLRREINMLADVPASMREVCLQVDEFLASY